MDYPEMDFYRNFMAGHSCNQFGGKILSSYIFNSFRAALFLIMLRL